MRLPFVSVRSLGTAIRPFVRTSPSSFGVFVLGSAAILRPQVYVRLDTAARDVRSPSVVAEALAGQRSLL